MSRADRTGSWASIAVAAAAAAATFAVFAVLLANVNAQAATEVAVTGCDGEPVELSRQEWEMVKLHNQAREDKGLGYLCVSSELTEAARSHSEEMADKSYLSHYGPEGSKPTDRIQDAGADPETYGENLAFGTGEQVSPQSRFESFMSSEGHRSQVLSQDYTRIGVGTATGGGFSDIEGEVTLYTVDYAAPAEKGPPQKPEVIEESTSTTPQSTSATTTGEEPMMETTTPGGEQGRLEETVPPAQNHPPAQNQYGGGEQTNTDSRQVSYPSGDKGEQKAVKEKVCKSFAEEREEVIGELRRESEEEKGLASEIKSAVADDFEEDFLRPGFCDLGPVKGNAGKKNSAAGGEKSSSGEGSGDSIFGEGGIFGGGE